MNTIINNLHLILPGIAFVLWALSHLVKALGNTIPGDDFFDRNAARVQAFSDNYAWALDKLCELGLCKLKGLEKTQEIHSRLKEAEKLWNAGKRMEVIAHLSGVMQSAQSKLEKAGLPIPFPATGSGAAGTTKPPAGGVTIGPDDVAKE